jgi:hypothetical protein
MPRPAPSPVSPLAAHASLAQGRPLPPTMTVRDALGAYLGENGFDTLGYTAPTYEVEAFGRRYTLTNTPDRMKAIPLHDLHHVATGYGTDLVGEGEIGAWELRAGCRTPIVYVLNLVAALLGLVLAPRRMARAWRAARGAVSLYRQEHEYAAVLDLTLGELRDRLRVPADGVAREPRRLHETAAAISPPAPPAPHPARQ